MSPEIIVLLLVLVALSIYTMFGGADFGVGVWQFNLALRMPKDERELMHAAIGPVWEANHVWLIFAIVLLLNAFPAALAAASQAIWVPLLLALVGIIFRGAAFAFRSYSVGFPDQQYGWEVVFALASTMAPFFLGAAAGMVASGDIVLDANGRYQGNSLTDWMTPLAWYVAFFTVGMCAYASAVLLTGEGYRAGKEVLTERWRRRSLVVGTLVGAMAAAGLFVVRHYAAHLWGGLMGYAAPAVWMSMAGGFLSLWAMWRRQFLLAAAGVFFAEFAVVLAWGIAQYPYLIPTSMTIADAAAPANVLIAMIVCALGGMALLTPGLVYLFIIFKTSKGEVRTRPSTPHSSF